MLRRNYSLKSSNSFINSPYGIVTVLAQSFICFIVYCFISKKRRRSSDRILGFLYPCTGIVGSEWIYGELKMCVIFFEVYSVIIEDQSGAPLFNNTDRKITYTSYHGYCDPTKRCGTHITSWTAGCCEFSTNIKVRNFGSYYVYYLNGIPTCYGRYSGTY